MKITSKVVYEYLDKLYAESAAFELTDKDRWVIFSDLHMGDGGSTDDFKMNAGMFEAVLKEHYLQKKFSLLLNGDVEELQRFPLKKIQDYWSSIFSLFDRFREETQLLKTIGNHDLELGLLKDYRYSLNEGIKFRYKEDSLFVFHGHQASKKFQKHNKLIGYTLKYFANPLGIKNYSVAHSSTKQFKIEKRAYHYSVFRKIVSVLGHTHRPLFESLHKVERLKYKIETLCREFSNNPGEHSDSIREAIKTHKKDLKQYYKQQSETNFLSYVYNTIFHIPCLFNSGCVIGKRGMTCLEIENGMIRLVHWFDEKTSKKYLQNTGYDAKKLSGTDYYRMVINEESLDYIFTRINLLS